MGSTNFSNAKFAEVFRGAIATTKEYLVDKKPWTAPFEATDEGKRRKAVTCQDGILQEMEYSSIANYILSLRARANILFPRAELFALR